MDSGFQLQQDAAELYQRQTAVFMRPLVHGLLDAAGLREGQRILDLACGPGIAAVEAAQRVGPTGHVVGADINPGMIEVARRTPPAPATIEWHVASALELPFEDDQFDVVVVQQGVQFFPDLPLALSEMRRVTRPGGVVAATSWTPVETSPYLHAQLTALSEVVGTESMATFHAAFALTGEAMEQAWAASGLDPVSRSTHAPLVDLPPLEEYVPTHLDATPWGPTFRAIDADGQRDVIERIKQLLAPHTEGGVATVPFSTWVVTGRA